MANPAESIPKPEPAQAPAQAPAEVVALAPAEAARAAAKKVRTARVRRLLFRLALFVVLPTALAALYYGVVASDQYESVSLFTIQSAEARPSGAVESIIGIIPGVGVSRDTLAVRDYILSHEMLARLEAKHAFSAHYKDPARDLVSRLASDAPREDVYEYYRDKVRVGFDSTSGVLRLTVLAYTSEKAHELSKAILAYSEEKVNHLSDRARQDQTAFAAKELAQAEERLSKARQELQSLQQERAELNPQAAASAALSLRTGLEAELAKARAEVLQLKSYMQPNAPQVLAAEQRAASLAAQVANESRRMVSPDGKKGLNTSIAQFEGAAVEKEFAQHAYEFALKSVEIARTEASRQHRYLATIAEPTKAESSTHPRRALGVLTVFVFSFLLLGIGWSVVAAVKEHARL
jgi:capsular polysaccharide transport system permease protein